MMPGEIDRHLGAYHLTEMIGSGGMGRVYLATHGLMGKVYAVKVLPQELACDPGFVARFRDEAHVMADLRHPRIVQVHYMGVDDGTYFLAMDYVPGPNGSPLSLHAHLRRQPETRLVESQALTWATQIAEALAYAHDRGVVHRDIKPGNVLIDADWNVKLIDFGLVKAVGTGRLLSQAHESMKTLSGARTIGPKPTGGDHLGVIAIVQQASPERRAGDTSELYGTLDYMAPEQRGELDEPIDERTDIYAFGVLLYRIVTGRRPVGRVKAPSEVAGVSWHWDEIVDRCLEYDPADRWRSADAVLGALRSVGEMCHRLKVEAWRPAGRESKVGETREGGEHDGEDSLAGGEPEPWGGFKEPDPGRECASSGRFVQGSRRSARRTGWRRRLILALLLGAAALGASWLLMQARINPGPLLPRAFTAGEARAWQQEAAKHLGVDKLLSLNLARGVALECILIPPGRFLMGSPRVEDPSWGWGGGQHAVTIAKPFFLGVHEVTRRQFATFVSATRYQTEAELEGTAWDWDGREQRQMLGHSWRKVGFAQSDDHPVVNVSWNDAVAFCKWVSSRTGRRIRLPKESEWEYACRAGTRTAYQWGDDPHWGEGWCNAADQTLADTLKWTLAFGWTDGYVFTAPVGQFRANPFGLYDMHGNVAEWCADSLPGCSLASLLESGSDSRKSPDWVPDRFRSVRGGCWINTPASSGDFRGSAVHLPGYCRSAAHSSDFPSGRNSQTGFRVAVDLK